MIRRPVIRRFCTALAAVAASCVLFRAQIAEALVVRGDEYLYANHPQAALERYRRASIADPDFEPAADRYVFVSLEMHTRSSLREGMRVATEYLAHNPDDPALLADRALCLLRAGRYRSARADFERSARFAPAPQTLIFAGWVALRSGDKRAARAFWNRALLEDPRSSAARVALARVPR